MRRLQDFAVWLAIFLCGGLLASPLAHAQQLTTASGLLCDTPQEVSRFIELYKKGDDGLAIAAQVNTEVGKSTACGFAIIEFYENEEVSKVRGVGGPARIVRITIVRVHQGYGWQPIAPYEQYVAIPIVEQES